MKPHNPPLGTVKYIVHYQYQDNRKLTLAMEVENNSMATTNLVVDFYRFFPGHKIISYTKM